jgi:hypothetical protein
MKVLDVIESMSPRDGGPTVIRKLLVTPKQSSGRRHQSLPGIPGRRNVMWRARSNDGGRKCCNNAFRQRPYLLYSRP